MRIVILATLLLLSTTAIADQTITVGTSDGDITITVPDSSDIKVSAPPVIPPVVTTQEPHWRMTAEESQVTNVKKEGNAYNLTIKDTHPTHKPSLLEVGSSCVTFINKRWPQNPGIIIAQTEGSKHCYALPKDGASNWLLELLAGRHPKPVNIWSRWHWAVQGVLDENGNKLSTIDCIHEKKWGDTTQRTKTCIGGRHSHDITVRNINVQLATFIDNELQETYLDNDSYRCIMPGDGDLLVENVFMYGCKHGIQGERGKTWTLRYVRIENASAKGSGLRHAVYSDWLELLLVEDSFLHSIAGIPLKSRALNTIVRRTTLKKGWGDTGVAFHMHLGRAELEDVTIIQPAPQISSANPKVIMIGGNGGNRCDGDKPVYLKLTRVAIIDNDPREAKPRFEYTCDGILTIEDGGENTYSYMGGPERNLFKDGRIDLKGVQP